MSYQAARPTATIQWTVSDALGAQRPPDTVHPCGGDGPRL